MNPLALTFLIVASIAVFSLPRKWAIVPLLAGCLYITKGQGFDIGGARFTLVRFLIAFGLLRILGKGERPVGGLIVVDKLMLLWAVWAMLSSLGHEGPASAFVFRGGLVLDHLGIYFLCRTFCSSIDDVISICKVVAILLVPVAAEMFVETLTGRNLFAVFGGVSEMPEVREGRIRAQGPFQHSILAGTIGAACFPLMVGLWRINRFYAAIGAAAALAMIVTCSSSGPVMSVAAGVGALILFRFRWHMRAIRWAAALFYVLLNFVMADPAYFIMARIDITGGSTGWHRARLIQSAFQHLGEWWFMGTDFTRHWMATGVSWSPNHTDITNYYLKMGVWGGLPLMLIFIALLIVTFVHVGQATREQPEEDGERIFFVWAIGASLFALAATAISVSFFDQSFVFVYMTIAVICSVRVAVYEEALEAEEADLDSEFPDFESGMASSFRGAKDSTWI